MHRSWGRTTFTITALMCLAAASHAQPAPVDSPPPPPPAGGAPGEHPEPGESQERARARLREMLTKGIENWRARLERMEHAVKLIDEGAPLEQVRAVFPQGLREGGMGGRLGDMLDRPEGLDRQDGPGDGRAGERPDHQPGLGGPDDRQPRQGPGGQRADGPGRAAGEPEGNPEGRRGPREAVDPSTLTDEHRQFLREFVAASNPELLPKLEELERRDPEAAKRRFADMWPRTRWLWELRRHDPDLFKLRLEELRYGREALDQARWIVRADKSDKHPTDAERSDHMNKMRQALQEQYRVRGRMLQHDITRTHEHLEEMQKDLAARDANEQRVIDEAAKTTLERARERADRPDGAGPGGLGGPGERPDRPAGRRTVPGGETPPPARD